jgi:hypothetical protein
LPGLVPAQGRDFSLEGVEGPQAMMLLRKPSRPCQPLQIMEEAADLYSQPRLCTMVNFASLRRWLCSHPQTVAAD